MSIFKRESLLLLTDYVKDPHQSVRTTDLGQYCLQFGSTWQKIKLPQSFILIFFWRVMARWKEYFKRMSPVAASKVELCLSLSFPCFCCLHDSNRGLSCTYSVHFVRKRGKTKSVCNAPQTINSPSEFFKNYCAMFNYMLFLSHFFFFLSLVATKP